jgi:hypothetical protein
MKTNIFWEYLPLMGLIYVCALMLLSLVYLIAKFLLPVFDKMKVGKVKLTLGFYFTTLCFLYMCAPYLVNQTDRQYNSWQIGIPIVSSIIGYIMAYHYGTKQQENQQNNLPTPPNNLPPPNIQTQP